MAYQIEASVLQACNEVIRFLRKKYESEGDSSQKKALKDANSIAFEIYAKNSGLISETMTAEEKSAKKNEVINDTNTYSDYKIIEFLVLAGMSSYFGFSNIDIAVDGERNFGYTDSMKPIKRMLDLKGIPNYEFNHAAFDRLLAVQRECSYSEYFSEKYYEKDIELVRDLISGKKSGKDEDDEEEALLIKETFADVAETATANICDFYRELLSASFGIDEYRGVITLQETKNTTHNETISLSRGCAFKANIAPEDVLRRRFIPLFKGMVNCKVAKNPRQFDNFEIYQAYQAHKDIPLYFPYKVLEIIGKAKWTYNANIRVANNQDIASYTPVINNNPDSDWAKINKNKPLSLDTYMNYLADKFLESVLDFCVEVCRGVVNAKNNTTFTPADGSVSNILDDVSHPKYSLLMSIVRDYVNYYKQCVTTAVVIMVFDYTSSMIRGTSHSRDKCTDFRIAVSNNNRNENSKLITNVEFCARLSDKLTGNPNTFSDDGVVEETDTLQPGNFGMYLKEYAYTLDSKLANARPIFAYKALTACQEQGKQIDWSNILLGKYSNGALCESGLGKKVELQKNKTHFIIAGSRSGKGVMCYNIFATAVASGIPIFYCDRKPDTAVVMKSIGNGMFAVNGGDYKEEFTLGTDFFRYIGDGKIVNYRIPEYLESALSKDSVKADLVYFRAILLWLCLTNLVDSGNQNDPNVQRIQQLMKNGNILVLDEFTNFFNDFLSVKPVASGDGAWFGNCYSENGIMKVWSELDEKLTAAEAKYKTKQDEVTQRAFTNAQDKAKQTFDFRKLYFSALVTSYMSALSAYKSLINAGSKMSANAQIFVIGQDLSYNSFGEDGLSFNNAASSSMQKFTKSVNKYGATIVPLMSFLGMKKADFIIGYHPDNDYMGCKVKGTTASSMLTADRRGFVYASPGGKGADGAGPLTPDEVKMCLRTKEVLGESVDKVQQGLAKTQPVFFKPFLILNNSVVPPVEQLGTDGDITDTHPSEEIKNARKNGASQYVGQCLNFCNEAGLSWKNLLDDNHDENGDFVKQVGFESYIEQMHDGSGEPPSVALSKSGEIMNILVRDILGYTDGDWLDFLADFRPEAIFTPDDFVNATNGVKGIKARSALTNTFFNTTLMKSKYFSSLMTEELGSLIQYYDTGASNDGDGSDHSGEEIIDADKTGWKSASAHAGDDDDSWDETGKRNFSDNQTINPLGPTSSFDDEDDDEDDSTGDALPDDDFSDSGSDDEDAGDSSGNDGLDDSVPDGMKDMFSDSTSDGDGFMSDFANSDFADMFGAATTKLSNDEANSLIDNVKAKYPKWVIKKATGEHMLDNGTFVRKKILEIVLRHEFVGTENKLQFVENTAKDIVRQALEHVMTQWIRNGAGRNRGLTEDKLFAIMHQVIDKVLEEDE